MIDRHFTKKNYGEGNWPEYTIKYMYKTKFYVVNKYLSLLLVLLIQTISMRYRCFCYHLLPVFMFLMSIVKLYLLIMQVAILEALICGCV